jgi:hypothetical protein
MNGIFAGFGATNGRAENFRIGGDRFFLPANTLKAAVAAVQGASA